MNMFYSFIRTNHFYRPHGSVREDNVFSFVYLSTGGGGGYLLSRSVHVREYLLYGQILSIAEDFLVK